MVYRTLLKEDIFLAALKKNQSIYNTNYKKNSFFATIFGF